MFPARQHLDLLFAARFNISFNVFAARLPVQPADCTLWLFCDKTELFRRGLCGRGQNIVFYLIFSAAGQVTSVNRDLSKPDPEQTTNARKSTFQLLETKIDNN